MGVDGRRWRRVCCGLMLALMCAPSAVAQPDMGLRRPDDPPPTRYAIERIETSISRDLASLERARRAARTNPRVAVEAAIALRETVSELAGVASPDQRPEDGDLVLAARIVAEFAAWDQLFRRAVNDDGFAEALGRFAEQLDPGSGDDARLRLATAVRTLVAEVGPGRVTGGGEDAGEASVPERDSDRSIDATSAGARLDAAIRAAGWLGGTEELLVPHRAGEVGVGGASVVARAAAVIESITAIDARARRRARLRDAIDQLAEAWPPDADPRALANVDRGWRRLAGLVEIAVRRRDLAGRVAPAGLSPELRRLTGVLVERAEEAELTAIDRVGDLLLGPGPSRDPALVSLVVGFRRAVENLDRLHQRADWLAAVEAIDAAKAADAAIWIDDQLIRLGAPAQRVQAARRLDGFDDLLALVVDPIGLARMDDPTPADRALVGNRTREIVDAFAGSRRERLALALGGEAAPAAGAFGRWIDLLAMIELVGRARELVADGTASAAASNPDWFVIVPDAALVADASRAIDVAVDRAIDAEDGSGPPTDAVAVARRRIGIVAAWSVAVRAVAGEPMAAGWPPSAIAATRPSTDRGLAEISAHAIEAAAARAADDDAAADAHRAMAIWIAATDYDPARTARPDR